MTKPVNWNRNFRDPSRLTAYEEKIWKLHKEGLDPASIAKEIGTKHASTISSRLTVIKEKLEVGDGK